MACVRRKAYFFCSRQLLGQTLQLLVQSARLVAKLLALLSELCDFGNPFLAFLGDLLPLRLEFSDCFFFQLQSMLTVFEVGL